MPDGAIRISPTARAILAEMAGRTGRPASDLLDVAVVVLQQTLFAPGEAIPGVDPLDVWEAAAQAEAGQLTPHEDVFARLRGRK